MYSILRHACLGEREGGFDAIIAWCPRLRSKALGILRGFYLTHTLSSRYQYQSKSICGVQALVLCQSCSIFYYQDSSRVSRVRGAWRQALWSLAGNTGPSIVGFSLGNSSSHLNRTIKLRTPHSGHPGDDTPLQVAACTSTRCVLKPQPHSRTISRTTIHLWIT